jgi:hypothetical protein
VSSPSLVSLFKREHPEFANVPDAEIEAAFHVASTPAAPEPHPKGMVTPPPQTESNSAYGDLLQGAGHHALNTALSLGELARSAPGGELYQKAGDIVARLFGYPDPGIQEAPTLAGRISDERAAADTVAPPPPVNAASKTGAAVSTAAEALATLPVSEALAIPAASGISLNLGRALLGAGREGAINAAVNSLQEGSTKDAGTSALLGAGTSLAGTALGGVKNALSSHLADTLLPTPAQAVLRGGDAGAGLQDSNVIASGAKSLYRKLNDAAMASTEKTLQFVKKNAPRATFDRDEVSQVILNAQHEIGINDTLDTATKRSTIKKLQGLYNEFTKANNMASGEDLLTLRRRLGETISWSKGDVKTGATILKNVRQDMYSKINEMLDNAIPGVAEHNQRDFNLLTARDAAESLLGKGGSAQEGFLVRRGVPLLAGSLMGAGAGYTAGGSRGAALGGLAGGYAMSSPAAMTTLVQALKNSPESTMAQEILARVFGITPELASDPAQGGPPR